MIETRTGRTYYPRIIGGGPEGLVGTITLALETPDNVVVEAPSTEGIVETSDGAYTGTRVAPSTAGTYIVVWYDSISDISLTEELVVTAASIPEMGLYYATPTDVRTYLGVTEAQMGDDILTRPIRMAQRDIDAACGGWDVYTDTMLKFATDDATYQPVLSDIQATLLVEATCAQVEYRLAMGDDFMIEEQYESRSGPGYSVSGQLRKVTGAAYTALGQGGLLRLHGRASNAGSSRFGEIPRAN